MTDLNLHLLLAVIVGATLVLLPLLAGLFVRPRLPTPEKDAVYECGEPTIGSSYIQFDLRFYVVALLFIIFDVEVVFFFPWATIFGGATQLADPTIAEATRLQLSDKLLNLPPGTVTEATQVTQNVAQQLAWIGFADILVFFGVLLVGFAYVWHRGDLDWVRAMVAAAKQSAPPARPRRVFEPADAQTRQPETVGG
jgi:NADH-quinone oxidoreductase subunit A